MPAATPLARSQTNGDQACPLWVNLLSHVHDCTALASPWSWHTWWPFETHISYFQGMNSSYDRVLIRLDFCPTVRCSCSSPSPPVPGTRAIAVMSLTARARYNISVCAHSQSPRLHSLSATNMCYSFPGRPRWPDRQTRMYTRAIDIMTPWGSPQLHCIITK